ncbi:MAG: GNAT family N-acetyltransferase [Spirochaetes bacterium]|nr:GNAT family N-acetyltransferase [Spirochaetota bacterium]
MKIENFTVRPIQAGEIGKAAELLSDAYYHDVFFKWCVDSDEGRRKIVSDYYKVYLSSRGCVAHVAAAGEGLIGATVWLPHDADAGMYDEIERVVGAANAPMFREVAEKSHKNEPTGVPFYQLVGFGVLKEAQGRGVGQALLKYHLDILDEAGIPTYLEASTPFTGGGVYGKFGYAHFGELMTFGEDSFPVKLYPLFRDAKKKSP